MGLPENGVEIPLIWTKQWYHTWIILCLLLHQSGDLSSQELLSLLTRQRPSGHSTWLVFFTASPRMWCEFSIARWDSKRHTQVPNPLSILHCWRVNPQIVDELLLLRVEPILDPDDHSGFSSPWASYHIISVNFSLYSHHIPAFPRFWPLLRWDFPRSECTWLIRPPGVLEPGEAALNRDPWRVATPSEMDGAPRKLMATGNHEIQ